LPLASCKRRCARVASRSFWQVRPATRVNARRHGRLYLEPTSSRGRPRLPPEVAASGAGRTIVRAVDVPRVKAVRSCNG
jgi:hypothetical protein